MPRHYYDPRYSEDPLKRRAAEARVMDERRKAAPATPAKTSEWNKLMSGDVIQTETGPVDMSKFKPQPKGNWREKVGQDISQAVRETMGIGGRERHFDITPPFADAKQAGQAEVAKASENIKQVGRTAKGIATLAKEDLKTVGSVARAAADPLIQFADVNYRGLTQQGKSLLGFMGDIRDSIEFLAGKVPLPEAYVPDLVGGDTIEPVAKDPYTPKTPLEKYYHRPEVAPEELERQALESFYGTERDVTRVPPGSPRMTAPEGDITQLVKPNPYFLNADLADKELLTRDQYATDFRADAEAYKKRLYYGKGATPGPDSDHLLPPEIRQELQAAERRVPIHTIRGTTESWYDPRSGREYGTKAEALLGRPFEMSTREMVRVQMAIADIKAKPKEWEAITVPDGYNGEEVVFYKPYAKDPMAIRQSDISLYQMNNKIKGIADHLEDIPAEAWSGVVDDLSKDDKILLRKEIQNRKKGLETEEGSMGVKERAKLSGGATSPITGEIPKETQAFINKMQNDPEFRAKEESRKRAVDRRIAFWRKHGYSFEEATKMRKENEKNYRAAFSKK